MHACMAEVHMRDHRQDKTSDQTREEEARHILRRSTMDAAAMAHVETPTIRMIPSAQTCFDSIKSTRESAPAVHGKRDVEAIRFFDDDEYTRYIREQLEKDDNDDDGTGRKTFRPKCVAVGPRFHGDKELKLGEEIKRIAAWEFWVCSDQPFAALYAQVEKVARGARGSYADASSFAFTEEEFTAMMFVDGCFLLHLISHLNSWDHKLRSATQGDFPSLVKQLGDRTLLADIFVVENQIPWAVLEALMSIRPIQVVPFIDMVVASTFDEQSVRPSPHLQYDDKPMHLLDLLCKRQIADQAPRLLAHQRNMYRRLEVATLTSATQLAEAGVGICPSRTPRFADIAFSWQWPVFGSLSLPPLILRHQTLGLLLNMLAFELLYRDNVYNRCHVAAYFGMLAALMVREEDVQQLRHKGIIETTLSDEEVIKFFKKMELHSNWRNAAVTTYLLRANINDFFKRQRMWIVIHRFVYKNLKFLIAIGSFLSVSLSILKAILALPAGSSK